MSRSGYVDDLDQWALIRWRGAVKSALRGKRGQSFLRELLEAMRRLPEKKLIANELEVDGQVCALGAVGKIRGLDMSELDPDDRESIAAKFGIPEALAAEIVYENDEGGRWKETDEERYERIRSWVEKHISELTP